MIFLLVCSHLCFPAWIVPWSCSGRATSPCVYFAQRSPVLGEPPFSAGLRVVKEEQNQRRPLCFKLYLKYRGAVQGERGIIGLCNTDVLLRAQGSLRGVARSGKPWRNDVRSPATPAPSLPPLHLHVPYGSCPQDSSCFPSTRAEERRGWGVPAHPSGCVRPRHILGHCSGRRCCVGGGWWSVVSHHSQKGVTTAHVRFHHISCWPPQGLGCRSVQLGKVRMGPRRCEGRTRGPAAAWVGLQPLRGEMDGDGSPSPKPGSSRVPTPPPCVAAVAAGPWLWLSRLRSRRKTVQEGGKDWVNRSKHL